MRVMYHTEVATNVEDGGRNFDKIIEVKNVTFYPMTREVQVGNRFYEIPDEVDFEDLKRATLKEGWIDVTEFPFTVENNQVNRNHNNRGNNRRFNNGGYNSRRRFN